MRFPFATIPALARKAPLGPPTLNTIEANGDAVAKFANYEHDDDGVHNALEIPRLVGRTTYGGSYANYLFSASPYWTSNANPSTGKVTMTLDADGFTSPYIVPLVSVCDESVLGKPWIATAEVTSATSVSVYLSKLTSALGSGNVWAATDGAFSVLLHSTPAALSPVLEAGALWERRDPLSPGTWNTMVEAQGAARVRALAEHTSAGVHDSTFIAREYGLISYDTGVANYRRDAGDISSVTKSGTGICTITTSNTFTAATAIAAFPQARPTNNLDIWVVNWRPTTTTSIIAYLYQYNSATDSWALADGDFFIAIYGTV